VGIEAHLAHEIGGLLPVLGDFLAIDRKGSYINAARNCSSDTVGCFSGDLHLLGVHVSLMSEVD
jgi:hypothetical protein